MQVKERNAQQCKKLSDIFGKLNFIQYSKNAWDKTCVRTELQLKQIK